ncbi:efflux RND transporter permease subunit [Gammaproteobacteria bacterium]|nr:efflux RND transporter permease subunit [Gammaproteobacteria bacterium]|tara:strand:+ start:1585 stop:4719 length:3135 start_codon:yes stop_codon:yes gene_type:complete
MTGIVDFALSKARTTLAIGLVIIIAGAFARSTIQVAADPNIQLPLVSVSVFLDGASPSDASRLIARPLETRLRSVPGIKELSSSSRLSFARIVAEFEVGYDIDTALRDIKQAVEEVKFQLPREAEDPQIREYSFANFPVMNLSLVGSASMRQKVFIARELQDRLEAISEVLAADLEGAPEEVLEGIIDKSKMETYGITLSQLAMAIRNNNLIIPGGAQDTGSGKFNIEVPSIFETAEDVYNIPVKVTQDAVVTLSDIAEIRRTFKDFSSYAKVNGQDAVTLEIRLRVDANAIEAKKHIIEAKEEFEKTLPQNLSIVRTNDETVWAEVMISELEGNIITAIFLVMILVIASMGVRVGMLVGLSIPFCFLLTFIILRVVGVEFNFLVMMGLLLGLGMLIDGAIVVTEYADRKISEGLTRLEAYRLSSKRMFFPIISSTATTIAAFTPLIFWPGFTGQFMRYLPITVFIVLSASLVYALIITPVVGSIFGQRRSTLVSGESEQTGEVLFDRISEFYSKALKKFVKNPGETIIAVLMLLWFFGYAMYGNFSKGTLYFADVDPVAAEISIRGRGNFSSSEAKEIMEIVEEKIQAVDGIENLYLTTGSQWFSAGGDTVSRGFIEVVDSKYRDISGKEVIEKVQKAASNIPGIIVEITPEEGGPSFSSPIELGIFGDNEQSVAKTTEIIEQYMLNDVVGLANIRSTLPYSLIEWKVQVDKQKAAQLGVSIVDVGALVQMLTNGFKVGEYRPDDSKDEIEIRARFGVQHRSLSGIENLKVNSINGLIPVSTFIKLVPRENRQSVVRRNGKFFHEIGLATESSDYLVTDKVNEMSEWLAKQEFDAGIETKFRGMQEETEQVTEFLAIAAITALALMLILLVTQFNSFYQSTLVLSAVFMSVVGVLIGLLITGKPFSTTMTGIAIVALSGIVVNNNIVLIDTFNRLTGEFPNLAKEDVIIKTCKQRLRPILLTTATTIFGLLPLAIGLSIDVLGREIIVGSRVVGWWQNLASSIVFGLAFSTVLTLIFTPAALILPSRIKAWLEHRFKFLKSSS